MYTAIVIAGLVVALLLRLAWAYPRGWWWPIWMAVSLVLYAVTKLALRKSFQFEPMRGIWRPWSGSDSRSGAHRD